MHPVHHTIAERMRELIEARPAVGFVAMFSAGGITLLGALQIISAAIGILIGLFGLAAAIYTFLIKQNQYYRDKEAKRYDPEI